MKFFVDTANLNEIREAASLGILDGVTTNPSHVFKAGRKPMAVSWRYYEFAQRLLENKVNLAALKGRRGESMPELPEWTRITSYLQYERFAETVIRQAGDDAETDVDKLLEKWGKPRLVADVEGVRFYGR